MWGSIRRKWCYSIVVNVQASQEVTEVWLGRNVLRTVPSVRTFIAGTVFG